MQPNSKSKITWYIQCYQDHTELKKCIFQLRKVCPRSRVILCSDGDPDPRFSRLAEQYQLDYHFGERLFTLEHGGDVVHRMLHLFLSEPSSYLVKIDPDTQVLRKFGKLPDPDNLFIAGTLQGTENTKFAFPSIQGGCILFSHASAHWLHRKKVFLSDRLKPPHLEWLPSPNCIRPESGLTSHDWTIGWAASKFAIPLINLPAVHSTWRPTFFKLIRLIVSRNKVIYHPRLGWNYKTLCLFMKSIQRQLDVLLTFVRKSK